MDDLLLVFYSTQYLIKTTWKKIIMHINSDFKVLKNLNSKAILNIHIIIAFLFFSTFV